MHSEQATPSPTHAQQAATPTEPVPTPSPSRAPTPSPTAAPTATPTTGTSTGTPPADTSSPSPTVAAAVAAPRVTAGTSTSARPRALPAGGASPANDRSTDLAALAILAFVLGGTVYSTRRQRR